MFESMKLAITKIASDMKEGRKRGNVGIAMAVIGGVFTLFLTAAIYLLVLGKVGAQMTAGSAEANATTDAITALSNGLSLAGVLPIVGVAVAIIALVAYIGYNRMGGGR